MLSTKEITVVFANVEDLLLTNTVRYCYPCSLNVLLTSPSCGGSQAFVSSLEERQKDCRLYIDKIGDILLSHIPNMSIYMVTFPFEIARGLLLTPFIRNTVLINQRRSKCWSPSVIQTRRWHPICRWLKDMSGLYVLVAQWLLIASARRKSFGQKPRFN